MTMGRSRWILVGIALMPLAIACVALARAPSPSLFQIDLNRDVCLSQSYDQSDLKDVSGELVASPFLEKNAASVDGGEAWLTRIKELMGEHNSAHRHGKVLFMANPVKRMGSGPSYKALANGVACKDMDTKKCRNRNFWFFKPVPPQLAADIVFRNTIREHAELRKCPF